MIIASIFDKYLYCNVLEKESMIIIDYLVVKIWSFEISRNFLCK